MPLPSSGPLSISQIRNELIGFGSSYSLRQLSAWAGKSTPDAISEFYGYAGSVYYVWGTSTSFEICGYNEDFGEPIPLYSFIQTVAVGLRTGCGSFDPTTTLPSNVTFTILTEGALCSLTLTILAGTEAGSISYLAESPCSLGCGYLSSIFQSSGPTLIAC